MFSLSPLFKINGISLLGTKAGIYSQKHHAIFVFSMLAFSSAPNPAGFHELTKTSNSGGFSQCLVVPFFLKKEFKTFKNQLNKNVAYSLENERQLRAIKHISFKIDL